MDDGTILWTKLITVRTRASSAIATWTNLATTVQYEALGSMKSLNYGNTLSLTQSWGNDGRLAEKRVYRTTGGVNLSRLTYSYDNDDNMIAINDLVDANKSASYGYDAMDRLVRADVASGALRRTDWLHDANGNRTAVERRALPTDAAPAETESYTTTSGTNRLASIVGPLGPRSIFYDGRGNSSTETRGASVNVSTAYDGFGRLTSYARTGEATQVHSYNGLDERVSTTTGSTARQFLYDPMGRAMGEYGASAAPADVMAEFVWLDPDQGSGVFGGDDGIGGYALLAVAAPDAAVPGTSKLSWVHASHMGVPLLHTDTTGTSTPQAAYRAPGFPGQHQTHADLYDNKHRDYDPTTGRYIQADPIGLDGDANPYAYAMNSPLRYSDPEGLEGFGSWTYAGGFGKQATDTNSAPWAWTNGPASPAKPSCPKPPPPTDWCGSSTNNTQWVFDRMLHVNIAPACRKHDACYASAVDRRVCDRRLRNDIWKQCLKGFGGLICFMAGPTYEGAVNALAKGAYVGTGNPK